MGRRKIKGTVQKCDGCDNRRVIVITGVRTIEGSTAILCQECRDTVDEAIEKMVKKTKKHGPFVIGLDKKKIYVKTGGGE